jgi:hypothetical protein
VRFLLPSILLALALGGCAMPWKKAKHQADAERTENSRSVEERRMRAVDGRDIASKRGAEIFVADPNKTFDPATNVTGGNRAYAAGKARTKNFYYDQKTAPDSYRTREFYGQKSAWMGDFRYSAKAANARGKYEIPNVDRPANTTTAATRTAWDAGKSAPSRDLPGGSREYRGPESRKIHTAVDPASMADWRNGGGETVTNTGTSVEKYTTLKELSIDDVRELLNKNK